MLEKNVEGQKWMVYAWDATHDTPKTGDAANITAKISKDHGARAALGDTNPTELEDGYYLFDVAQAETNADVLTVFPESVTANIQVRGVPETQNTMEILAIAVAGMVVAALRSAGAAPGTRLTAGEYT